MPPKGFPYTGIVGTVRDRGKTFPLRPIPASDILLRGPNADRHRRPQNQRLRHWNLPQEYDPASPPLRRQERIPPALLSPGRGASAVALGRVSSLLRLCPQLLPVGALEHPPRAPEDRCRPVPRAPLRTSGARSLSLGGYGPRRDPSPLSSIPALAIREPLRPHHDRKRGLQGAAGDDRIPGLEERPPRVFRRRRIQDSRDSERHRPGDDPGADAGRGRTGEETEIGRA